MWRVPLLGIVLEAPDISTHDVGEALKPGLLLTNTVTCEYPGTSPNYTLSKSDARVWRCFTTDGVAYTSLERNHAVKCAGASDSLADAHLFTVVLEGGRAVEQVAKGNSTMLRALYLALSQGTPR